MSTNEDKFSLAKLEAIAEVIKGERKTPQYVARNAGELKNFDFVSGHGLVVARADGNVPGEENMVFLTFAGGKMRTFPRDTSLQVEDVKNHRLFHISGDGWKVGPFDDVILARDEEFAKIIFENKYERESWSNLKVSLAAIEEVLEILHEERFKDAWIERFPQKGEKVHIRLDGSTNQEAPVTKIVFKDWIKLDSPSLQMEQNPHLVDKRYKETSEQALEIVKNVVKWSEHHILKPNTFDANEILTSVGKFKGEISSEFVAFHLAKDKAGNFYRNDNPKFVKGLVAGNGWKPISKAEIEKYKSLLSFLKTPSRGLKI